MARLFDSDQEPTPGELIIDKVHEGCVDIFYVPHKKRLKEAGINESTPEKFKTKILTVNAANSCLEIWPINTFPSSSPALSKRFLKSKYHKIKSIALDDYSYSPEIPTSTKEVIYILEELIPGFVKDYDYGLGLQKEFRFIINAIEEIEGVEHLILKDKVEGEIKIDNEFCLMSYQLFDKLRKDIKNVSRKSQAASMLVKRYVSHNLLAYHLEDENYPMQPLKIGNSSLEKMIAKADPNYVPELTAQEQTKIIDLVSRNTASIAKKQPATLLKLQSDLELVTLEALIDKYNEMIGKRLKEDQWQGLFSANPFILSLAFGYPAIKIQDQAFVGGRRLSGEGDKVSDFLTRNPLTNNSCIFEIKKPSSVLLNKKPYRGGVFSPSSEFSGAITQLSDQIYKFQKEIATIKENSKIYDIESFAVQGVLITGKTPVSQIERKSFELFRNNLKNITVITFDELLEKLKQLYMFLTENTNQD